jgi:hypothetical protein
MRVSVGLAAGLAAVSMAGIVGAVITGDSGWEAIPFLATNVAVIAFAFAGWRRFRVPAAPPPAGIPQDLRDWANGVPGRLRVVDLAGREFMFGMVGGSGDENVPGGRDEYFHLIDLYNGEVLEIIARSTIEGWGHLLVEQKKGPRR